MSWAWVTHQADGEDHSITPPACDDDLDPIRRLVRIPLVHPRARAGGPSAVAAIAFDLDEHDIVLLDRDDGDIETIDDAWLEPGEATVVESVRAAADLLAIDANGYPPALGDDEIQALIGQFTRELCRRSARR